MRNTDDRKMKGRGQLGECLTEINWRNNTGLEKKDDKTCVTQIKEVSK